ARRWTLPRAVTHWRVRLRTGASSSPRSCARVFARLLPRVLTRLRRQLVPAVPLVARVLVVLVPLGRSLPDAEPHLPRLREHVRVLDGGLVVDIVAIPPRPALDHVERRAVERAHRHAFTADFSHHPGLVGE